MPQHVKLIVYPVSNVEIAKKLFGTFLDAQPYVDSPYYVGYKAGDVEIGLDPNAMKQGITVPIAYTEVTDIQAALQALTASGAQILQDVKDVGGGMQVATVKDADGNILGLRQLP